MDFRLIFLILPLLLLSCTNTNKDTSADQEKASTEEADSGKYTLTRFSKSHNFPDASMQSMAFEDGIFTFGISGESYKLGIQTPDAPQKNCANSAQGQHIHLIVDDQPYAAKYEAEFDYEIPDGEHYILAFLSRSYHESIKTEDAHIAVKAQVKDNTIVESAPIDGPMLFYSRPKGAYTGEDTKRVMLDYYFVDANPADYIVRAEINGEIHDLTDWVPYYIEGLPSGDNTITLTLLDKSGNKVDAPYNPVSRTFKLTPDPQVH